MIELTDFKNEWEQLFDDFRDKIFSNLSGIVKQIEHIGSTSIHDMKAKDVIDVQIGISSFSIIDEVKSTLKSMNFEHLASIKQDHIPFHEFDYFERGWEKRFFKGVYNGQPFNVHVRILNNPNWKFALQFKKHLNGNDEAKYALLHYSRSCFH